MQLYDKIVTRNGRRVTSIKEVGWAYLPTNKSLEVGWALAHHAEVKMRLDKFLKVSRLIKRRTVANEVSDLGRVFVNGNQAKPSKMLKDGDIIKIEYPNRSVTAKVLKIPKGNISVQEAASLYELIEQ